MLGALIFALVAAGCADVTRVESLTQREPVLVTESPKPPDQLFTALMDAGLENDLHIARADRKTGRIVFDLMAYNLYGRSRAGLFVADVAAGAGGGSTVTFWGTENVVGSEPRYYVDRIWRSAER